MAAIKGAKENGTSGDYAGYLVFATGQASAGFSEQMRITSTGNVGIGTTTPSTFGKLAVIAASGNQVSFGDSSASSTSNGYLNYLGGSGALILNAYSTGGNTYQAFYTSLSGTNQERMRIDSSGNLLVGTTAAYVSSRFRVKSSGTSNSTYNTELENSAGTVLMAVRDDGYFSTGVAANSPYNITSGSAANCYINSDGGLYRSTSSLKYKDNVQAATHGLAELLKLRSVTYNGKSEIDSNKTFGGLIAEEVHEAGLTEFVQYADDGTPDALAYGNMVALCVKAIQEQQALIESLTTRLTALESK
jgi:hypothetical protein